MNEIKIRPATENDAMALLNIYSHYVLNTAITFEYEVPSLEEFKNRIRTISAKYPYLVAEENGIIVGYAYAGVFKPRAAYNWAVETTVYIEKTNHKKGIGRILYNKLEDYLKRMNITNANACITFIDKEDEYLTHGSPDFHERLGYKLVGRFTKCGYKFNRWYDMIWMEKIIGEHKVNMPDVIPFKDLL